MAYFAVISVMHTINRLLNSSRISIVSSSLEIVQSAYDEVKSVQQVLERLDDCSRRKGMNALDGEIREAVFKLEDVIESHLSEHFLPQSEERTGDGSCSIKLFSIDEEEIQSLIETVKKMKEEYAEELVKPSLHEEEEEDNYTISSKSIDFDGKKPYIVGLYEDELARMIHQLTKSKSYEFQIVSAVGNGGTSRTVFAKLVCEQALSESFERCAMVTIGPKCQVKDILIAILSQIDPHQKLQIAEGDDEYEKLLLGEHLYTCLQGSRYLIVLDDIREIEVWNLLRSSFPNNHNGSRVFLTTSLMEVAIYADSLKIYDITELHILKKDKSWNLIRELEPYSYPWHHAEKIAQIQLFLSEDDEMHGEDITEDLQLGNSSHGGGGFSTSDSAETIAQMFKLFDYVDCIKIVDADPCLHEYLSILGLHGMAGIGKTTLAREIFEDPSIMHCFSLRVWVTLGPNYQSENILADILSQIDSDIDKMHLMKGDEMLAKHFWTKASCKRCLVVLDDVWSKDPLLYLHKLFDNFKFEVLLTTTLKEVADFAELAKGFGYSEVYKMRLLNKEESWILLRENVFAEKLCPRELEKTGKMIAENCEGLPLLIAEVASLLYEAEKTLEYWTEVAKKDNLVFQQAYDKISEMLYPSYEHLPQFLKAFFLYMGVFPRKYDIPTSELRKLLSFDEIIEQTLWKNSEDLAMEYVTELVSRSLLLAGKTSSSFRIKTSSLHSVYWHLCIREARKNKFFHVLNRYSDGFEEYIEGQRRLCIQNNVLFGMKDVYDSMASISTARSLLCTGPCHQYQVPICLDLGLLRVLDALTIRFYEFPIEVVHLVLLRYFGLIYDGRLPPSISKLRNLECLIVRRHLHTKSYGAPLYLPKEIWDMKDLKHLQVMGSDLPDPSGAVLPNLITLLDISAQSVVEGVLRGTPNLKKLGIQIELRPDASEPMFSFDHLYHLDSLESLKCVVVNPEVIRCGIVASPPPITRSLPSNLKKLSLSGLGYPWEYMRTVAELPYLKVLKLRCYAFRGPEWVIHEGEFKELRYLLLEDTDLEYLKTKNDWFYDLRLIIIRHCYKLKEIPVDTLASPCEVELIDCSTSASNYIRDNALYFDADIRCSWLK